MSSRNICSSANPSEIAQVSICQPSVLYGPNCFASSGAQLAGDETLNPGGSRRGSKLIGDRYSFTSGCDATRWKRLMPCTLMSGLNGNTNVAQSLHSPGFSVIFCPLSSIAIEFRSFATVIVIGIVM